MHASPVTQSKFPKVLVTEYMHCKLRNLILTTQLCILAYIKSFSEGTYGTHNIYSVTNEANHNQEIYIHTWWTMCKQSSNNFVCQCFSKQNIFQPRYFHTQIIVCSKISICHIAARFAYSSYGKIHAECIHFTCQTSQVYEDV